ncbi:hypothetical protein A2154_01420 [Candidatus Gottesmanbacteria bacterium RBG_16_43_7]|uniref:Uncharacterized protein n=1 Tax=Candidatus Gottesmanbacteria bacterium RBG_16_43_7 TaxID=1798373 RepID=A0A1F5ZAR9_9BACT|nr:MAG: hypothetical protein A2154_01420 [Candidatus Gottesmanbacteria bacterium RBG_16_43_7]
MKIKTWAILSALLGFASLGGGAVMAHGFGGFGDGTFVSSLAQKLGIEESRLQSALDQMRAEHQVQMQSRMEERLNQAVSDGKITETQQQLILTKHQEIQAERQNDTDNWQNLTPQERRSRMEQKRAELEKWASENGIDMSYFGGGFGHRGNWRD